MEWKDEEWKALLDANTCGSANDVRLVAARAVELAAARGGTMTAEEHAAVETRFVNGEATNEDVGALLNHANSLGARNAVLEAELELARKGFDPESPAQAEIESPISRLHSAEEGTRELTRRAQQAEANLATMTQARDYWHRKCAPLPAAGQVLSAHVSNDARAAITDCPMTETCVVCGASPGEACNPRVRHHLRECGQTRGCALMKHHPCSPTCTHDDAATPGHPTRVKERSEAVNAVTGAPDPVGALAVQAGAKPGREIASYRAGYEQGCDDMRAACWEAVQVELRLIGWTDDAPGWTRIKSAIEGAGS